MDAQLELLAKRLIELSRKADNGGYYTFTDFLGLGEQSVLESVKRQIGTHYSVWGGAEGAERIMVRFGNPDELGYEQPFPILCIKLEPVSQRFADKLTHRDFLGALLNLGIERSRLGDIAILDNVGYVFAEEGIADYIISTLSRVKHTDIKACLTDAPSGELYRTERRRITLESERIDAVIAKVYNLSRADAQALIKRSLVYVGGMLCESVSYTPKPDNVISVRGKGRMIYRGYDMTTRKGKLAVLVDVYV